MLAGKSPQQQPARFGGWLEDVVSFDAVAFGISNSEAELMDAQQRLLVQVWPTVVGLSMIVTHCLLSALSVTSLQATAEAFSAAASNDVAITSSSCVAIGIASAEYNNWVLRRQGTAATAFGATGKCDICQRALQQHLLGPAKHSPSCQIQVEL
jgi:hypothetical protein